MAFGDDPDLLREFLAEAEELLADVDVNLVALEGAPRDEALLATIFRGFHTIKGGAGFLEADALVTLCHRTENVFDMLRKGRLTLNAELLDSVLAATGEVKRMFGEMSTGREPAGAPQALVEALGRAAAGETLPASTRPAAPVAPAAITVVPAPAMEKGPDWAAYLAALTGRPVPAPSPVAVIAPATVNPHAAKTSPTAEPSRAPTGAGRRAAAGSEASLRIDAARFDQILNLSGEIGLTRNRLKRLEEELCPRGVGPGGDAERPSPALEALQRTIAALDAQIDDLQSTVMKARLQPVGRVFQKYLRLARDLARKLGKDVELTLQGEETEIDKTILDELNDPLVHLVRNAIDHGLESGEQRTAAGKAAQGRLVLSAAQVGDHIVISLTDDGRGMRASVIRDKAVEKGCITPEAAARLSERECLELVFLPGFSTRSEVSDLSGRGVGMDVVKTTVSRLRGRLEVDSEPGRGTRFTITLPLTLAILPVLMMKSADRTVAVPLTAVREVIPVEPQAHRLVSSQPHLAMRGEVLPMARLSGLLGWPQEEEASIGVVLHAAGRTFVACVQSCVGQDEVMIKPLQGLRPQGVAGATQAGDGSLVVVLDPAELLPGQGATLH